LALAEKNKLYYEQGNVRLALGEFLQKDNPKLAFEHINAAMIVMKSLGNNFLYFFAMSIAARLASGLGKHDEALDYADRCLTRDLTEVQNGMFGTLANLVVVFTTAGTDAALAKLKSWFNKYGDMALIKTYFPHRHTAFNYLLGYGTIYEEKELLAKFLPAIKQQFPDLIDFHRLELSKLNLI